ncbi:CPBP family intramembrane metalloprotease [Paenalcaligenes niemegkensis]|uniref:CPBP family intramembrane glutamic endopeptidase n=1 Tax=Paenalcaligenes niemegkensis TaxID=2895469 RepID=UPI001EE7C8D0|nr:CPBP family intramembrane glutamic endopeptidase [Paenalcaligenes niemegkensis]MCQ9617230.1 CPBP family intramembrane metalloprotease [Paenalcaligenes niemegkensis]
MVTIVRKAEPVPSRFRDELHDFFRFLRAPTLSRHPVQRGSGNSTYVDWFGGLTTSRIILWALFLWGINLLVFGPLAAMAAGAGGAQHRLNLDNIPWLQALIWAPIVEELVFRFGLRRPALFLWLAPVAAVCMISGPVWYSAALVVVILFLLIQPGFQTTEPFSRLKARRVNEMPQGLIARYIPMMLGKLFIDFSVLKSYRQHFIWVLYASTLAFAALHLYNFHFTEMPLWLMPLLVLPQFCTGLVLAWIRVRRGIGAAMFLHAVFNGGPLLLVWLIIRSVPDITM